MSDLRCPGRAANASMDSILVPCPKCANSVEIFGDEIRVHCRCGQWVFREALPSCAHWCQEAEKCFGQIGDFRKALRASSNEDDLKAQEERLRDIQKQVSAALVKCSNREARERDGA